MLPPGRLSRGHRPRRARSLVEQLLRRRWWVASAHSWRRRPMHTSICKIASLSRVPRPMPRQRSRDKSPLARLGGLESPLAMGTSLPKSTDTGHPEPGCLRGYQKPRPTGVATTAPAFTFMFRTDPLRDVLSPHPWPNIFSRLVNALFFCTAFRIY